METLADDPFWKDIGLATTARIRRMLDIEYVSEIFILTMDGIQDGKSYLDKAYSEYEEEIPDLETHRRAYETCKTVISNLWPHLRSDRFSNFADFYSLWAAVVGIGDAAQNLNIEVTARNLTEFANSVRAEPTPEQAQSYLIAVTQGSNKGANRKLRADILRELFANQE